MDELRKYVQSDRRDFEREPLKNTDVPASPYELFRRWLKEAVDTGIPDPYAMALGTVGVDDCPAVRIVYMRDINNQGIVFYTNYTSQKGKELEQNPCCTANFFWPGLERQIRWNGKVQKVSEASSDEYFASRPRKSQLGAWASEQSHRLESRQELEQNLNFYEKKFASGPVPRPGHWGGYLISPATVEFWQGQRSRLHDRFLYRSQGATSGNAWKIERLYP